MWLRWIEPTESAAPTTATAAASATASSSAATRSTHHAAQHPHHGIRHIARRATLLPGSCNGILDALSNLIFIEVRQPIRLAHLPTHSN